MNHFPKHSIYKVPDGYFEALPERIIRSKKAKARQVMLSRIAAAAVLVIGFAVIFLKQPLMSPYNLQAEMDQEVEFYINSGYWNAEDVLSFSENPDQLLDIIIAEEWSDYLLNEDASPIEEIEY